MSSSDHPQPTRASDNRIAWLSHPTLSSLSAAFKYWTLPPFLTPTLSYREISLAIFYLYYMERKQIRHLKDTRTHIPSLPDLVSEAGNGCKVGQGRRLMMWWEGMKTLTSGRSRLGRSRLTGRGTRNSATQWLNTKWFVSMPSFKDPYYVFIVHLYSMLRSSNENQSARARLYRLNWTEPILRKQRCSNIWSLNIYQKRPSASRIAGLNSLMQ